MRADDRRPGGFSPEPPTDLPAAPAPAPPTSASFSIAEHGSFAIPNAGAKTFSFPTKQRATCPKHGRVPRGFHLGVGEDPGYKTPDLCPYCYVDWTAAHVTNVVVDHDAPPLDPPGGASG